MSTKYILVIFIIVFIVACEDRKTSEKIEEITNELNSDTEIGFLFDNEKIMNQFKTDLTEAGIKYRVADDGHIWYSRKEENKVKAIGDHIFACHFGEGEKC